MSETNTYTLRAEQLAYYDAFICGLLPVKVLRIFHDPDARGNHLLADVRVTADRKSFDRGEVLLSVPADKVLHRRQVYTRSGQYRIRGQATYRVSEGMPRNADGSLDERYTVKGARHTADCTMWTARFCGEWIGHSATKAGAEHLARTHSDERA